MRCLYNSYCVGVNINKELYRHCIALSPHLQSAMNVLLSVNFDSYTLYDFI